MENFTDTALSLLDAFTAQRPGLEFGNYGDATSYRADVRRITKDLHHYRAIRQAVAHRTFTRKQWGDAFQAFSGRLQLQAISINSAADCTGGDHVTSYTLNYCTGQYFPIEYRRAACAVLASLLWNDARTGEARSVTESAGDYLQEKFRRQFGRTIANRWFN